MALMLDLLDEDAHWDANKAYDLQLVRYVIVVKLRIRIWNFVTKPISVNS